MNKDMMIDFLIDNESVDDLKADLKKYFHQVEEAKHFIYTNYFDEESGEWINKDFQRVYYYLDFNNNEVK